MCDKDNLVVFSSKQCLVVNINTGDVVLRGKQHKNVCKVSILSLPQIHSTCLSVFDVMLWHQTLGYVSFFNKLVSKKILCIEESVHVLFDKTNSLVEIDAHDDDFELGLTKKDLLLIHDKGK